MIILQEQYAETAQKAMVRRFLLLMGSIYTHQLMASQPKLTSRKGASLKKHYPIAQESEKNSGSENVTGNNQSGIKAVTTWNWYPDVNKMGTELKKGSKATFSCKANQAGSREIRVHEQLPDGFYDKVGVVLEPGSEELLTWALHVGNQMLTMYSVKVESAPAIMQNMCNIYDAVISKRCMCYDLRSRQKGKDGRQVPLSVIEYALKCIVKCGLLCNAEESKMALCFGKWRLYKKKKRKSETKDESVKSAEQLESVKIADQLKGEDRNKHKSVKLAKQLESVKIANQLKGEDRNMLFRTMRLLIDSDQQEMLLVMLRDVGHNWDGLLNEALRLAIYNDKPAVAFSVLEMGASTFEFDIKRREDLGGTLATDELTKPAQQPGHLATDPETKMDFWKELLIQASDEPEERYLKKLIEDCYSNKESVCGIDSDFFQKFKDLLQSFKLFLKDLLSKIKRINTDCGDNQGSEKTDTSSKNGKGDEDSQKKGKGANGIRDDKHAIEILGQICKNLVHEGSEKLDFFFTKDVNDELVGFDFCILLAMVLVNRVGLLQLFFTREGRCDATSILPNALWICLISKKLSNHSEVGRFNYHLKTGLEVGFGLGLVSGLGWI